MDPTTTGTFDPGDEPKLVWIPANQIHADAAYQAAKFNIKRAEEIAKAFDPNLFHPLMVNHRADGTYFAFDGQHRLYGIKKARGESELVPCLLYEGKSAEWEAYNFDVAQRKRVTPSAQSMYEAGLIWGEPTSVLIREVVERHGYTIADGGGSGNPRFIYAVGALRTIENKYEPGTLDRLMSICAKSWYGRYQLDSQTLRAVATVLCSSDNSEFDDRLVEVLATTSPDELLIEARDLAIQSGLRAFPKQGFISLAIRNRYKKKFPKRKSDVFPVEGAAA